MAFAERFPEGIWDPIEGYEKTGAFSADGVNDTKLVLHRTQGDSYPRSTYRNGGGVPHWTILHNGTCYTHYDINQYSRALLNLRGGVQTNLDEALQVEIVGFTGNDMEPEQAATLGRLIDWCLANTSLKNIWLGGDPSKGRRLTNTQWDDNSGIVPHLKVPENNHTDTITNHDWLILKGETPATPKETDTMTLFHLAPNTVIKRTVPLAKEMLAAALQKELNTHLGHLGSPLRIDGYFGNGTEVRVKLAQAALGITADGVWGNESHTALQAYINRRNTRPTPPPAAAIPSGPNPATAKKLLAEYKTARSDADEILDDLITELLH